MPQISLGNLRDYWRNMSDWITGNASHSPSVQLSGSNVEEIKNKIAPGISHTEIVQKNFSAEEFTTSFDIFESSNPCRIESVTLSSNSNRTRLYVYANDEGGQSSTRFKLPCSDGQLRELELVWLDVYFNKESSLWRLEKYDTEENQFVMNLIQPINLPTGGSITLTAGEFNHDVAVELVVSHFDDGGATTV